MRLPTREEGVLIRKPYVSRETASHRYLPVSRETRRLKIGFTWNGWLVPMVDFIPTD